MKRKTVAGPRYGTMTVPGKLEDGSDTWWYVVDRVTRKSTEMGQGAKGLREASRELVRRNRPPRDRRPKKLRPLPLDSA